MRTSADRSRTPAPDWEDLRHFLALARAGTLSGAARALRVHHATVARRVAALEATLGQPLLERRAGAHALTAAGRDALERAAEMERAAAALSSAVTGAAERRLVRLTATPALLEGFLLPRLAPLVERHPGLELELLGTARPLSLARHEADLALRMGTPRRGELLGRRVATVAYRFYATPAVADAMARGTAARRIGFDEGAAGIPEAAWLAETWPDDRPAYRASTFPAQALAARAGLGVVLLPRFMGDPDPALVEVPIAPLPPPRPVWLLRRASARSDPHVREVADFLDALFRRERGLFGG
jgi:DNA-binding transcriptional LysR family regulator